MPENSVVHTHNIKSANCVKLLDLSVDESLSFNDHISRSQESRQGVKMHFPGFQSF